MITWDNVTAIAPELSMLGTDTQAAILAQVNEEITDSVWSSATRADRARAYLAAHLGTLTLRRGSGGAVSQETVGAVSRSYAVSTEASDVGSTAYGLEYERQVLTQAQFRFDLSA